MTTSPQMRAGRPGDASDGFSDNNDKKPRRRALRVFVIVVAIVVAILIVVAVIAEFAVRSYAEGRAEKEIESSLPSGTTGTVDVSIHGFSVILQALSGHLDHVTLTSHDLVVSKVPLVFSADLSDVPLASGGVTGPVTAKLTVDQAALNKTRVVSDVGGTVTLGSGSFTYQKSFALLGLPIKAMITAKPTVIDSGTALEITPTAAAVSGAGATLDGSALLRYLKIVPIQMCTAKYLPVGATIDSVSVVPKTVTLDLSSRGLPLTSSALSSKGRCS